MPVSSGSSNSAYLGYLNYRKCTRDRKNPYSVSRETNQYQEITNERIYFN